MRNNIIFLILIIISSCKSKTESTELNKTEPPCVIKNDFSQKPNSYVEIKIPEILVPPAIDSEKPKWLVELYPKELKMGAITINQTIDNFEIINDSLIYITFDKSDGVCSLRYLITFLNKQKIDSLHISDMCDHELSIPTYSWKESAIINQRNIIVKDYQESVIDSMLNANGNIKNNLDFLEVETILDSTLTEFKIDITGQIKKITTANN